MKITQIEHTHKISQKQDLSWRPPWKKWSITDIVKIFKTNTKKDNSEIDQKMDITCFAYVAEKYETMPFYRKIGVKIKSNPYQSYLTVSYKLRHFYNL